MLGIVWQNRSVRQLCGLGRDMQISHVIKGVDDHDGAWQDVRTFEEQPIGLPEVAASIMRCVRILHVFLNARPCSSS